MFALLAIALMPAAAAPESSDPAVIYRQLDKSMAQGSFDHVLDANGQLKDCTVTRSTGDKDLDGAYCPIVRKCVAAEPKGLSRTRCMDDATREVMRDIAIRRSAEHDNTSEPSDATN